MNSLLRQLERSNSALASILHDIELATAKLWSHPQAPWFTEHGPAHSKRIVQLIEQIVFGVTDFHKGVRLTSEELFVLLGSCFLHDVGMQLTRGLVVFSSQEDLISGFVPVGSAYEGTVRSDHPYTLYQIIVRQNGSSDFVSSLGLQHCPRKLQKAIAEVSLSHGKWNYLQALRERSTLGLRLDLLGALLQVGDVLDISRERVQPQLLEWVHLPLISLAHWILSMFVSSVVICSNGEIDITYSVPIDIYRDNFLAYNLRAAVEHQWVGYFGREAIQHLREEYQVRLNPQSVPLKGYQEANEVMNIRPQYAGEREYSIDLFRVFRGDAPFKSSEDERRIRDGHWPRSDALRAVMRAIVYEACPVYSDRFDGIAGDLRSFPAQTTSRQISNHCGRIPELLVRQLCRNLYQWRVLIERQEHDLRRDVMIYHLRDDDVSAPTSASYWYNNKDLGGVRR